MKSILDRAFRYVRSEKTDIRVTIRREQKRLREQEEKTAAMLKEKIAGRIGGGKG